MKVLYAIQGTGNGHVARAREIVPVLEKYCELDILISGIQSEVTLAHKIKYSYCGLSFIFGKNGGVDLLKTYTKNKIRRLWQEYQNFPAQNYDLVINDFEPITAWASKKKSIPCISLSHQSAVISQSSPKPAKRDFLGEFILHNYAPTDKYYGFHFESYNQHIHTPVIRREIRQLNPSYQGHYTVYLPSYGDEKLLKHLGHFKDVKWDVFSKHNKQAFRKGSVFIQPINNQAFIKSLERCNGVLCGAGFEAPAEALFLGKKVLAIPMKGQYEQQCNAAALKKIGVPIIKTLNHKYYSTIDQWLSSSQTPCFHYPDEVEQIISKILSGL